MLISILTSLSIPMVVATAYDARAQNQISIPPSPNWHKYVRAPPSKIVYPARIVSSYTTGNVTNPEGLVTGTKPTIFTRTQSTANDSADAVPSVVIDFGQNVAGYLSINFAGAFNDTPGLPGVRLAFSETIQYGYLTDISDFTRSDNADGDSGLTPGSDQIAVRPDIYNWTDANGCEHGRQVCADGFHGFRYVRLYLDALDTDAPYTSSYGQVAINSISLNFTAYLGTPETFTGWFDSSDQQLNQYWYDGVYTNDLNTDTLDENSIDPREAASPSILGKLVLLDGAKRDRDPYVGDIAVAGRTLYVSHNASEAARNVLADLADHQRADGWIPPASIRKYNLPLLDYPLHWITCTYDLYLYTNDIEFVTKYYKTIALTLDTFYPSVTDPVTQLITKGIGISGGYGDYAFLGRTGPITYLNVLYVLALNNAAIISKNLGYDDDAARWTARAQNVSAAVNKYRWDAQAGAYWDGDCGSAACPQHAQDGNSISIVAGVANSSRADAALSYMSKNMARPYGNAFFDTDALGDGFSQRVYAFISYFEIEARFMSGKADSALDQIRRTYGHMASNDPGITMWEGIGTDGQPYEQGFTSMAHGWSTGVVPALTNFVLGVLPTGPGFKTWTVKPMPGDLQWASGEVSTPEGPLSVHWKKDGGSFIISVSSPAGTSGTISIPASNSSSTVFVNDVLAWENRVSKSHAAHFAAQDSYVSLEVAGGDYTVRSG